MATPRRGRSLKAETEPTPPPPIPPETRAVVPANGALDPVPANLLAVIARATADPRVDVEKMRALLDMMRDEEARQAERAYNRAFAAMAAKLPQIERLGTVDTGKGTYKFAKREDQDRAIRPIMAEFGFAFQFRILEETNNLVRVEGVLIHTDGHRSEPSVFTAAPDTGPGRNPTQARGSAITYAERYIAEGLLNLVRRGADDDGRGYVGHEAPTGAREVEVEPPKPQQRKSSIDPNSWLGKVERALDKVSENGWEWVKTIQRACKQAPDGDNLIALEGMTKAAMPKDMPQEARDDVAAAFLTARLRLSNERAAVDQDEQQPTPTPTAEPQQPEALFYLVDPWGEIVGEFATAKGFADQLAEAWGKITDEQIAAQLLENNEETIERAQADADASEILRVLDEPILPADPDDAWADQAVLQFEAVKTRSEFTEVFAAVKAKMLELRRTKPDIFDRVDAVVARRHKDLPA